MSGWDDKRTAEYYDNYAKMYATYRVTNRDLAVLARIDKGMSVVDLACGTGVTSQSILEQLAGTGHVYALDSASAMIDLAKKNLKAYNISFFLSKAERMHEVLPRRMDRVLCNSAFWQMNIDETLKSMRSVLAPEAIFAFNMPATLTAPVKRKEKITNLRLLMRIVAQEEFAIDMPKLSKERRRRSLDAEKMTALLEKNGFNVLEHRVMRYQNELESSLAFCKIPIMTEHTLPGVDYNTRMQILERAYEKAKVDLESVETTWDYYLATPV